MNNFYKIIPSPVGQLTLIANEPGLMAVLWENEDPKRVGIDKGEASNNFPLLQKTEQQLQEYFAGQRQQFDLPLHFIGTDFQQQVWQALLTIPYGQTRSYLQIAQQYAPWVPPTVKTPSPLSPPAIVLSAPPASSPVSLAGWKPKPFCCS
jgi:methylated-DNA-[protein]-cysteine S-methyltransferase